MATADYPEYSLDAELEAFFTKTSATHAACDAKARELTTSENVVPVEIHGTCSYSVYAGAELEYVVQFRLESLGLKAELMAQVREVYADLAPRVSFEGMIGDAESKGPKNKEEKWERKENGKEPLYVYKMTRVKGITHLEYILAKGFPENSAENLAARERLMGDLGRFMARSWLSSSVSERDLRQGYLLDLQALQVALPKRFQLIIAKLIASLDEIFESLPMVLLHKDLGSSNIIVDENTCHLTGVIDWAEATVCPFGMNLHSLEAITGKLHLRNGWVRYEDYDSLWETFWRRFGAEVKENDKLGDDGERRMEMIGLARVLGLVLSKGFTSRIGNEKPVPITAGTGQGDAEKDERARYNLLYLDGFLLDEGTRWDGLD
ncbi:hypothetical protein QBC35DRAFT_485696 [Podospora australis]|uniref:Aminoglycoside phosphotransferase domain-containing protein n=1 Tax=Podospora australis TaxID=1536484 RepID=A0AAN6X2P1_9PEZI|nr:hypothetical protein QBC35DRAFT_485696 [Podospora australis]